MTTKPMNSKIQSVKRGIMKFKKIITFSFALAALCTNISAKTRYISPNNDGIQDELEIPIRISDKRYVQAWSLIILDEDRNIIRTIENKVSLPEKIGFKSFFKQLVTPKEGVPIPSSVTWNGAMNNGETAPDGLYYYYLTATDDNGNVGKTKEYKVVVDTVSPHVTITQPADKTFGEGSKLSLKVVQTGSEEDLWTGTIKSTDGSVVKTYKWEKASPAEFTWFGTNDDGVQVADGVYSYEITATDRAGNKAPQTTITNIIYSADKPVTNIFVDGSRYFSPGTESKINEVVLALTIPIPDERTGNSLVSWEVSISDLKSKDGKIVKTYGSEKDGTNPPSIIIFDGLDDNGKLLPDGEYKATVSAKYSNGYIPSKVSSPVIVLDTKSPAAQISASDKVFGGGTKDNVKFTIVKTPDNGSPVNNWKGQIKTADGTKIVKTYNFGQYLPSSVTWNGITDGGALANDDSYVMELFAVDLAGNAGGGKTPEEVRFDTSKLQLMLTVSASAFSPNGNNVKDTISFTPVASSKDIESYTLTIFDKAGKTVYTENGSRHIPVSFVWDGKGSDRMICSDGIYKAKLLVKTPNGDTPEALSEEFELDTVAPSLTATIPWSSFSPDNDGNQENIPVTITKCSDEKLWTAEVRNSSDKSIKTFAWNNVSEGFTWDGTDESGNIAPDGTYSILIFSTDEAGNSFSTELKDLVLDSRETKAYITAEYEGISPNADGVLDTQHFEIKTTVPDGIKTWQFNIVSSDGTKVYSLSNADSENLPSDIIWNGADSEGNVCEGTFTGNLEIDYVKGNHVSVNSTPFICTAEPPVLVVQTAPAYFSPDNDGVDDELYIRLKGTSKANISSWSFKIKEPRGNDFWKIGGTTAITERIIWDGLSNIKKDSNGNAERVQSATDYIYEFVVTDNLGMTSTVTGIISVDVLVIRDGNVLKMAVPSIIFESDASNFDTENEKLSQDKIDKNLVTLNRIADILKKFKDYRVEIVGHANRTTNPYNEAEETQDSPMWGRASIPLSGERADAIREYLVKRGVSAANVSTKGMGGTEPVTDPYDRENNWKNRRVEFILVK